MRMAFNSPSRTFWWVKFFVWSGGPIESRECRSAVGSYKTTEAFRVLKRLLSRRGPQLDSQNQMRKCRAQHKYWGGRGKRTLGTRWPTTLKELWALKFSERHCLKIYGGQLRSIPGSPWLLCNSHTQGYTYTQNHRIKKTFLKRRNRGFGDITQVVVCLGSRYKALG